jgi:hypothetical protein
MAQIVYAPANVLLATAVPALAGDTPDNFRANINNRVGLLDAKAQFVEATLEQFLAQFGNGSISGGTIAAGTGLGVTVTAFTAFVGSIVGFNATQTLSGLTDASTNSLFLRQDGTFTVNTTGTPPIDISTHGQAFLWGTAVTSGGVVTSVTNTRRLMGQNLSTIYVVGSDPSAPLDGDAWYRSDTNVIKVRSGGTTRATSALT